ncbi:MAG TPA: hypothetical protein VFQ41_12545 [Candidatus Angelobacter sp.]|nr:hypothetical protein [Candidatus Angelobacter sp.]
MTSIQTALAKPLARLLAVLMLATALAGSQEASSSVKAEIERLRQSLKDKPISNPDMPDLPSAIEARLKDATAAQAAGRLYLSLERLGEAEDYLQGLRAVDEKAAAIKDSLPAFESEWGKASLQLTALEKVRQRDWSRANAAIRAISEAAQGRATPLLEGARGFATATKPKDGLFYMGEAQGEAAFAAFVSRLHSSRALTATPLRSLLPELEALQEKTNASFQPPRSIDMHPRFIALNATIKFARELDSSRAYAGALYQYLEAVRHYGMLDPAEPDATKQVALRGTVAEELKKLSAAKRDDSIAQIFLERASGWLNKADGSAPSGDEWRAVQVIVGQVLPAYYAALKPAAPFQQQARRTATLTLVRWPYT